MRWSQSWQYVSTHRDMLIWAIISAGVELALPHTCGMHQSVWGRGRQQSHFVTQLCGWHTRGLVLITCEDNAQLRSHFYPQSKKAALASLHDDGEKDRVRDEMEGLDLFYLAPALIGMKLRHWAHTSEQLSGSFLSPHSSTVPEPRRSGPCSALHTHLEATHGGPCPTQPSLSSSILWARNSRQSLHKAVNSTAPTKVQKLAHSGKSLPSHFSWCHVGRQRLALLPGCEGDVGVCCSAKVPLKAIDKVTEIQRTVSKNPF